MYGAGRNRRAAEPLSWLAASLTALYGVEDRYSIVSDRRNDSEAACLAGSLRS